MLRYLVILFSIYFLYRFIFGFLVPLFRTTRKIKQQFRNMQQQMDERNNSTGQASGQNPYASSMSQDKSPRHDYIEFEEVK